MPNKAQRLYGWYHCVPCNKRWESGHAWRGVYQKCAKCKHRVAAYRFRKLEKGTGAGPDRPKKPHKEKLCGKCIRLGLSCQLLAG